MTEPSVSFFLLGHRFGASAGWRGQEEERCFICSIDDGGSRRRGAVETRRLMSGDGLAQEGDTGWRNGGVGGSWTCKT